MKMKKNFLILPPSEDRIRFRNIFRLLGADKIRDFIVQLEVDTGSDQWIAVVRYDLAHGYFHRDLIYANGKREKQKIVTGGINEATINAIDDLKQNLEIYLRTAGFKGIADIIPPGGGVDEDLEQVKQYLLNLMEHPDQIEKVPDRVNLKIMDKIGLSNSVTVVKRDSTGRIIEVR